MERAARVWERLSEIFGILLVNTFGKIPPPVWVKSISKLTDIEIQRALTKCLERDDKYPPTLNEFLNMSRETKIHQSHKIFKPLLKPKADKNFVKAELLKMREILR